MKSIITFILIFSLLALNSCKKNSNNIKETSVGKITDKGTPIADPLVKNIGPDGGVITSRDGMISVSIPAGAVTASTEFSIQPITNNTPNGVGLAYRLLPEGQLFSKEVTITFHYTDDMVNGSISELLLIAYQDSQGIWRAKTGTQLDKANKAIFVTTDHFSDWSEFLEYKIDLVQDHLAYGEKTNLVVSKMNLAGLNGPEIGVEVSNVKADNWTLDGEGTLNKNSDGSSTYTAPSTEPATNPQVITAELDNIVTTRNTQGKLLLMAEIYVANEYMQIEIDGNSRKYSSCTASYIPSPSGTLIVSGDPSKMESVNMMIGIAANGPQSTSLFGLPDQGKTSIIAHINNNTYQVNYTTCFDSNDNSSGQDKSTDGKSVIQPDGNEFISGTFSGTIAQTGTGNNSECDPPIKVITGRFRARVTQ
jgi:hypothetical protein